MILSIRVNNYKVYSKETIYNLTADMRIKKFDSNVHSINNFNILKSSCLYGANNVGKSCMIQAIKSIKDVMLSHIAQVPVNIFSNSSLVAWGITFLYENHVYAFDFKYDIQIINNHNKKGFVYEKFSEITIDKYKNQKETILFLRDTINNNYEFKDNDEIKELLKLVSTNNILIYTINTDRYPIVDKYKSIFINFAKNIDILDMNNIPIENTIRVLKENKKIREKTVELIKLADLDIEDYLYVKNNNPNSPFNNYSSPQEAVFENIVTQDDLFKLASNHKGKIVPSIYYDSTGTKKMVAIASYIVDALTQGKVLVVDELDSSLHFKLTRAIVALFNNDLNKNAQLIFTLHDITLLDCKKLFRKDQIWFANKDENGASIYPLTKFTAEHGNTRSNSDLITKYECGDFSALPEPDLINILLDNEDSLDE